MTLTQQLMISLGKTTDDNLSTITLKNALDFYNEMWPTLESKIKQGSDKSIKETLVLDHGVAVIRNTFIDRNQAPPETKKIKEEFEKAKKLIEKVSNLEQNEKKFFHYLEITFSKK